MNKTPATQPAPASPRHILAIFNTSWGEVDWLLPLLWWGRRHLGHRVTACFLAPELYEDRDSYRDLHGLLAEAADRVIWSRELLANRAGGLAGLGDRGAEFLAHHLPRRLAGPRFGATLQPLARRLQRLLGSVDYVFREHDDFDCRALTLAFPGAREVIYPHSPFPHGKWLELAALWGGREAAELLNGHIFRFLRPGALVLEGGEADLPFWARRCPGARPLAVGQPKLDPGWVARLAAWHGLGPAGEPAPAGRPPRVVLYEVKAKNVIDYERWMEGLLGTLAGAGCELLVKGYPRRQKNEPLARQLARFPGLAARHLDCSALGGALKADLAISFAHSTTCLDAVAAGVPVVEVIHKLERGGSYFHRGQVPAYHWYPELQATFGDLGLTLPLGEPEELAPLLARARAEAGFLAGLAGRQRAALAAWLPDLGRQAEVAWQRILAAPPAGQ